MLKVIMMIDCNICGQPFDRIATAFDKDPETWQLLCGDLERKAQRCGWKFLHSAHHCDCCLTDAKLLGLDSTQQLEWDSDIVPF